MTVAFLTIPLSHTPCQPIRQQRFHCSSIQLHLSPLDVPFEPPLVAIGALLLAFSAQSWINSLLGGDQGLGAFLSDGTGFNKSGFKQRKGKRRPITDERSVPDDPSKPLGAGDPIPVSIGYRTLLHILNVNF